MIGPLLAERLGESPRRRARADDRALYGTARACHDAPGRDSFRRSAARRERHRRRRGFAEAGDETRALAARGDGWRGRAREGVHRRVGAVPKRAPGTPRRTGRARIKRAMAFEHLDEDASQQTQRETDRVRGAYISHLDGTEMTDPSHFHLYVDATDIDVDVCVDLLARRAIHRLPVITTATLD